jgi:hypothetical protein
MDVVSAQEIAPRAELHVLLGHTPRLSHTDQVQEKSCPATVGQIQLLNQNENARTIQVSHVWNTRRSLSWPELVDKYTLAISDSHIAADGCDYPLFLQC